jgi:hypothetical protein
MGPGPSGSILAFHPDVCKRRYGLDLVMMRLKHTGEADIHPVPDAFGAFRQEEDQDLR